MSKVICDVCGTTYPETSSQCPICGCAKNSVEQTAAASAVQTAPEETTGYSYVKGGRFSKKNVRKRNNKSRTPERRSSGNRQDNEKTNLGLIVVVVLLLLAIVAVVIYIGVRFFAPKDGDPASSSTGQSTLSGSNSTDTSTPSGNVTNVPCTGLSLSCKTIEFMAAGDTYNLTVEAEPMDTTDAVEFRSSNKEVAMVSESGTVMAVGHGEATITVTCGSVTAECSVVCSFGGTETTEPDTPTEFTFAFNTRYQDETSGKYDISFNTQKTWTAYTNDLTVDPSEITWISDNPSVCTIDKGIVTVVGPGTTEIHAEYNGKTYTCIVRSTAPAATEPVGDCTISHTDVTLKTNVDAEKSFTLTLKDSSGNVLDVTWTAKDPSIVTIDGNKVTAAAVGKTEVYVEYEGVTYSCIIRVYEAN